MIYASLERLRFTTPDDDIPSQQQDAEEPRTRYALLGDEQNIHQEPTSDLVRSRI